MRVAGLCHKARDRIAGVLGLHVTPLTAQSFTSTAAAVNGLNVSVGVFEMYIAEMRRGLPRAAQQPGCGLRAALVDTSGAAYVVTASGAAKTDGGRVYGFLARVTRALERRYPRRPNSAKSTTTTITAMTMPTQKPALKMPAIAEQPARVSASRTTRRIRATLSMTPPAAARSRIVPK
jgi:hypothetical protein